MSNLRTNYADDVLDTSINTQRRFVIKDTATGNIINADVVIEEITDFTTEGDELGANVVNEQNTVINQINNDLIPKKIAESPSTGTSSTKLDTLYSGFIALPQWKKERAVIRIMQGTDVIGTYHATDTAYNRFARAYGDSGSISNPMITLKNSGSTYGNSYVNSYGQFFYDNYSAVTNSQTFELWA